MVSLVKYFKENSRKKFLILPLLFAGISGFYFWQKRIPKAPTYAEVYRLVPEKISQSAIIKITLPSGIDKSFAKKHIKFEPEIRGNWEDDSQSFILDKLFGFVFANSEKNII